MTYKLNAKTDDSWDGIAYQADFMVPAAAAVTNGGSCSENGGGGAWHAVDLPFSAFLPTLRGRVVAGQPPLEGGRVRQLGFMLSKVRGAWPAGGLAQCASRLLTRLRAAHVSAPSIVGPSIV